MRQGNQKKYEYLIKSMKGEFNDEQGGHDTVSEKQNKNNLRTLTNSSVAVSAMSSGSRVGGDVKNCLPWHKHGSEGDSKIDELGKSTRLSPLAKLKVIQLY